MSSLYYFRSLRGSINIGAWTGADWPVRHLGNSLCTGQMFGLGVAKFGMKGLVDLGKKLKM